MRDKVYFGGPVDFGAVWFLFRAAAPPEHAIQACDEVYLSADRQLLLQLLGRDNPVDSLRIFVGQCPDAHVMLVTHGEISIAARGAQGESQARGSARPLYRSVHDTWALIPRSTVLGGRWGGNLPLARNGLWRITACRDLEQPCSRSPFVRTAVRVRHKRWGKNPNAAVSSGRHGKDEMGQSKRPASPLTVFSAKTNTNTERFFFTVKPESAQTVL